MDDEPDTHQIPLRSDGTRKRFWYDGMPRHIRHLTDSEMVEAICVAHGH